MTLVVVLAKSSAAQSRCVVYKMLKMLAISAMFSMTNVTILPLATFPENKIFQAGVAFTFFRSLNVKSSMSSETKPCWYKCHELFVNSPVMITVKSFLKCYSMQ